MIELLLQAERLLSVGLLDKAEQLYRQVANADPKNSIAVVGLARVTLDRGDDEGALELARRAVAIDPENAAAQRLVARLEEVLEYRQSAESLLFDRAEAVSALQAEVAAEVAAEVGVVPGGGDVVGAGETAEAADMASAADPFTTATDQDAVAQPNPGPALGAAAAPTSATDPMGGADDAEPTVAPVQVTPPPAVPPARLESEPASPPVTPFGATRADPPDPPWAGVKVPEPEPTPPPIDPPVPYIPPSTSTVAGEAAPTGILAYIERLFRRR